MRAFLVVGLLGFALGGCNMLNKPGGSGGNSGGGGGGGGGGDTNGGQPASPGGQGWSETFTEAPLYKVGQPIEAKAPPCSGNGFLKVDVAKDKPFFLTAKVTKAGNSCASLEVVDSRSKTVGSSFEACADETKSISSVGQEGGTWVVVQERYGCTGITVSLTTGEGTAPAAPAPAPEPSNGPTPEN